MSCSKESAHAEALCELSRGFNARVHEMWRSMGVSDYVQQERRDDILRNIGELYDGMIAEETETIRVLEKNIDAARKDMAEISAALKIPTIHEPPGMTLIQLEAFLMDKAEELRKIKRDRMERLSKLLAAEHDLCSCLGESHLNISPSHIPTDDDLNKLTVQVDKLMCLKEERLQQAEQLRDELRLLYSIVEEDPVELTMSRQLLVESDILQLITPSALKDLETLRDRLEAKQSQYQARAENLRSQLRDIYTRLEFRESDLEKLFKQLPGCKPSMIHGLEIELERCHELRKQNMEKFVISVRKEIEQLWDCCYYGKEKREQFRPFSSNIFSESLLELHEKELEQLKKLYENMKPVLDLFNHHQELWDEFVDMEMKANDPSRLLTRHRGGGLLAEQKKRKEIESKIPKIEKKLTALIVQYEEEHQDSFCIRDIPILDFINNKKTELMETKERLKKQKEEEKAREKENEMRYGSKPAKRAAGHAGGTPMKKSRLAYSANATSNVTKLVTKTSSNSAVATTAVPLPKRPLINGISTRPRLDTVASSGAPTAPKADKTAALRHLQNVKRRSIAQLKKNAIKAPSRPASPIAKPTTTSETTHEPPPVARPPLAARYVTNRAPVARKNDSGSSIPKRQSQRLMDRSMNATRASDETCYMDFQQNLLRRSREDIPHSSMLEPNMDQF